MDAKMVVPKETLTEDDSGNHVAQSHLQPVVRPKERSRKSGEDDVEGISDGKGEGVSSASGEWWHSSTLAGPGTDGKAPPHSPAVEPFQHWRERRWIEDEEGGEWSYSTGLGLSTMDILCERFGEASFKDASSWQPWATGIEPASAWHGPAGSSGTETQFRLASPKLRLGPTAGKPQKGEHPGTGALSPSRDDRMGSFEQEGHGAPTQDTRQTRAGRPAGRPAQFSYDLSSGSTRVSWAGCYVGPRAMDSANNVGPTTLTGDI